MNGVRRFALLALALVALTYRVQADDWKSVASEHGLDIYKRTVPGSDVVAMKPDIEMPAEFRDVLEKTTQF